VQPKIDIFNHFMPARYMDLIKVHSTDEGLLKRVTNLRMLWDLEARIHMLDAWPELKQVLSLGMPSPELLAEPNLSPSFARAANDGLAELVHSRPDKFPAFVASLPLNNVPAALEEMDRAVSVLGARGVQILTNVHGKALDEPEFFPIFERAAIKHKIPVWLHPWRSSTQTEYASEPASKYEIWQVLGWPFETSVAMARLVFSGLLDRLPELKIVTHHGGGMLPFFAGRAETLWAQLGSRSAKVDYEETLKRLTKKPIEYFKMFYGDTVLGGSSSALRCTLDFFGTDHVVFASVCPFDPEGGPMYIREGIRSVDDLHLSEADNHKIYFANAAALIGMTPTDLHT
jgi:predicted TIM-barrel fold metal-dependent hydrolase